jgi:hypothetical protein
MCISRLAFVTLWGLTIAFDASATSISYSASNMGAGEWDLTYNVTNNSLTVPISELTIYFNPAVFSNLAVGPTQPSAWDSPVAVPADPAFLPDLSGYAFFDTVASNAGIPVGASLGGFTVVVDYTGSGVPSSQIFQVVDPSNFNILDQGQTQRSGSGVSVSEPSPVGLLAIGLLFAALRLYPTHRRLPLSESHAVARDA